MSETDTITRTEEFVKNLFKNETTGHDWWHINRVRNLALKIADSEGGHRYIIEMAALLHDVDDWKISKNGNESKSLWWLQKINFPEQEMKNVLGIIDQVSFKGAGVETKATTLEAKIVQDADRLDAIGAIGIARTFTYGGNKGRPIYLPGIKAESHNDFESYKKGSAPTINHFYEKLLLLKNRLNTKTAIELAKKRHKFMEQFLDHFFNEWNNSV
jgi:uncharacterized protein